MRELVAAGALPRQALDEARLVLAEAEDEAVLRRTLYGPMKLQELTEEQTQAMLNAAQHLVDRQRRELDEAEHLVRIGAAAAADLPPYREELARREATLARAGKRADLFREIVEMVRREKELEEALASAPEEVRRIAERFEGSGVFLASQFPVIELEFQRHFHHPLPVSANGDTALHRSMGFDHRGRVDVALHPDSPEGLWLKRLLRQLRIPYFAFRGAVPGQATGAHFHIGPASRRINGDN